MSSFLCASKPADMKMISGLKRATAGKILSRHARFHMATWAPGPGMPTLIIRGPSPWGAASAPNSLSGSSTMSSCTRLRVRQDLPRGNQDTVRDLDHKGLFTLRTGMCPRLIVYILYGVILHHMACECQLPCYGGGHLIASIPSICLQTWS